MILSLKRIATVRLLAALAIFLVVTLSFNFGHLQRDLLKFNPLNEPKTLIPHSSTNDTGTRQAQIDFWQRFRQILYAHALAPQVASPITTSSWTEFLTGFQPADTSRPRPDVLLLPPDYIEVMKPAHNNFVASLHSEQQNGVPRLELPYTPRTQGVVSTAGGSYLVLFMTSLRMLRKTGSTLPVEVFLANSDEYEPYICDHVLPTLNARCLILSDFLKEDTIKIDHYQYKVFAILFSSFEEVLFLDADSFPVHDPQALFDSEPFASTGMVLWPDFWSMSESPAYFEIASIPTAPLSERACVEAGELMYSKSKHELSLLLATYYNMYGPSHYYQLLSQGALGEGDKETFGWAASVLERPSYHVKEGIRAMGNRDSENGEFRGTAMVQYDPREDYLRKDSSKDAAEPWTATPFFVHANHPKVDPGKYLKEGQVDGLYGPSRHTNGTFRRVWTESPETVDGLGPDFERGFWEEVKWVACELEDKFRAWEGQSGICAETKEYWRQVFGG